MPRLAELVAAGFAAEDGTDGMLAKIPVHLGAAGSFHARVPSRRHALISD
jgi:hypothetical protein